MADTPFQQSAILPPAADLSGQELGDYVVLRRLGSGGMAHVYLAEQKSLRRKVALKILRPELVSDGAHVTRFMHEARSAAALSQSNIVQIYDVGNLSGKHFIAQEYISGKNLKQYLTRFGAVEVVMAINFMRQVGLALQKAEEAGVIHRDIKPENIMLTASGEIKVTDFGLARAVNDKTRLNLTQIGITMGTPLYMSPEQIEGREIDSRTDIYSLGITAYHMLAGDPPFDGETALAVAMKHLNTPPPDLRLVRPDVPAELSQLIQKMMAKLPEERVQSAPELLKELRKIKIEVDDDWVSLAEKIAASAHESSDTDNASMAATRQLHTILRGNIRSFWTSASFVIPTLLLILASAGTGIALAWMRPVPTPFARLAATTIESGIPKRTDIKAQIYAARLGGTPDDFKAVLDYFPVQQNDLESTYYRWEALQRLGEMALDAGSENDILQAENFFRELSLADDAYYKAVGNAGMACVFDQIGFEMEAKRQLEELELQSPLGEPYILLLNKSLYERVKLLIRRYSDSSPAITKKLSTFSRLHRRS